MSNQHLYSILSTNLLSENKTLKSSRENVLRASDEYVISLYSFARIISQKTDEILENKRIKKETPENIKKRLENLFNRIETNIKHYNKFARLPEISSLRESKSSHHQEFTTVADCIERLVTNQKKFIESINQHLTISTPAYLSNISKRLKEFGADISNCEDQKEIFNLQKEIVTAREEIKALLERKKVLEGYLKFMDINKLPPYSEKHNPFSNSLKKEHIKLWEQIWEQINANQTKKVVISASEFQKLLNTLRAAIPTEEKTIKTNLEQCDEIINRKTEKINGIRSDLERNTKFEKTIEEINKKLSHMDRKRKKISLYLKNNNNVLNNKNHIFHGLTELKLVLTLDKEMLKLVNMLDDYINKNQTGYRYILSLFFSSREDKIKFASELRTNIVTLKDKKIEIEDKKAYTLKAKKFRDTLSKATDENIKCRSKTVGKLIAEFSNTLNMNLRIIPPEILPREAKEEKQAPAYPPADAAISMRR